MYVYHVCSWYLQRAKEGIESPGTCCRWSWAAVWVLVTTSGSSGKAAVLYCWANSPTPNTIISKYYLRLVLLLRFHEPPEMGWNYFSQTYFVECLVFKFFYFFIFSSLWPCACVEVRYHFSSSCFPPWESWGQLRLSDLAARAFIFWYISLALDTFYMLGIIYFLKIT